MSGVIYVSTTSSPKKDIIIRGGENVPVADVEELLLCKIGVPALRREGPLLAPPWPSVHVCVRDGYICKADNTGRR